MECSAADAKFPQGVLAGQLSSIHMFFMRFAIDAVFVDGGGTVLALRPNVRPWIGFAACRRAKACIELPAGFCARAGLAVGDTLTLVGE